MILKNMHVMTSIFKKSLNASNSAENENKEKKSKMTKKVGNKKYWFSNYIHHKDKFESKNFKERKTNCWFLKVTEFKYIIFVRFTSKQSYINWFLKYMIIKTISLTEWEKYGI